MKKTFTLLLVLAAVILISIWASKGGENIPEGPDTGVIEENGVATVVASLNEPFTVKNHTVEVWAVTEDSRCPSDVKCIQVGKVSIALNVASPSGTSTTEMEPGGIYTTETISLTLDKVEPAPVSTSKIPDGRYRFFFTLKDR